MQIGCHLGDPNLKIDNIIYGAIELGANAVQMFLNDPNQRTDGKPISNAKMIKQMLKNTGIYLVIHGKYLYNFCRSQSWQTEGLVVDLRKVHSLGSNIGVVIHQGKNISELKLTHDEAIQTYVDNLKTIIDLTKNIGNQILLENSCQQGTEIGYTLEDLADIFHRFEPKYRKRIGFCLDTCHIYVSGQLQMKSAQEVDNFFQKWDRLIGIEHLKVIHYNDSKTPFDGHHDRHEDIGWGYIGNPSKGGTEEGLKRVISWAKGYGIPLILEVHGEHISCPEQVYIVRAWSEQLPAITIESMKKNSRSKSKSKIAAKSTPKLTLKRKS